ncbi:MAG: hypothetical protein ABIO35_12185 [Nitrobacter sp.]
MSRSQRRSWIVWTAVSAVLAIYCEVGFLASMTAFADLKLEPGQKAELSLLSVMPRPLSMEVWFRRKSAQDRRPELGSWATAPDDFSGRLKFENPGAALRVVASLPGQTPRVFEAMPASGYSSQDISRRLTSDLAVETGTWRWPPNRLGSPTVQAGLATLTIQISQVDPEIAGETVRLAVLPALGFKVAQDNVSWLWFWFAWPLFAVVQVVWAVVLIFRSKRAKSS